VEKFFGKNRDRRLTVDQFKDFHMQLLEEVMKLEVRAYYRGVRGHLWSLSHLITV